MRRLSRSLPVVLAATAALTATGIAADLNAKAVARIRAEPGKLPFTFVLIGDPQGGYETFKKLLGRCAEAKPRFIVVLGDLTRRGEQADYDAYVEALRAAPAPVLSVIGNHDLPAGGRERYKSLFGKADCYADYAGCRIVLLDNAERRLTRGQAAWLDHTLNTPKRKFVCMHCPPFLGNWWYDGFMGGTRRFLELMRTHKVKRVFMGHLHMVDSLHHEGVDYLICGSGGIAPALLPFGRAQICYVSVTVTQDGEEIAVHPLP